MVNVPNFTAAAAKMNRTEQLETALKTLEDGLTSKHIWNVDYVSAKETLTHIAEKAMDEASKPYKEFYPPREWNPAPEPMMLFVYHPQFMNAGGAYKKLNTYMSKTYGYRGQAKELINIYLEMLKEVAEIVALVKSVQPFIEKGRKPSENPKQVDRTNTGLCSVCGRRHKLNFNGTVVDHGFTLPRNWYGRNGGCFGAGYKAWELAPDGAIAYKGAMQNALKDNEDDLKNLKAGPEEVETTIRVKEGFGKYRNERKTYKKGDPEFAEALRINILRTEQNIQALNSDIEDFTFKIENWKERPLQFGGAETQERWKSKLLQKGGN